MSKTDTSQSAVLPTIEEPSWAKIHRTLLFGFLASFPFSGIHLFSDPVSLSATNLLLGLLALSLLYYWITTGHLDFSHVQVYIFLLVGALVLVELISNMINPETPNIGYRFMITRLGNLITLGAIYGAVRTRRDIYGAFLSLSLGVAVMSVLAIFNAIELVHVAPTLDPRSIGPFTFPFRRTLGAPHIDYGSYGVIAVSSLLFLAMGIIMAGSNSRRIYYGVLFGIIATGVLVAQSRSTFIAFAVSFNVVLVVALWSHGEHLPRWVRPSIILVILMEAVASIPVGIALYQSQIPRPRMEQLVSGPQVAMERPLFGFGRFTFKTFPGEILLHNSFINQLVSTGLIGFGLFLAVWILVSRIPLQLVLHHRLTFLSFTLLGSLAAGFVENFFYLGSFSKALWIIFGLAVALSYVMLDEDGRSTPP